MCSSCFALAVLSHELRWQWFCNFILALQRRDVGTAGGVVPPLSSIRRGPCRIAAVLQSSVASLHALAVTRRSCHLLTHAGRSGYLEVELLGFVHLYLVDDSSPLIGRLVGSPILGLSSLVMVQVLSVLFGVLVVAVMLILSSPARWQQHVGVVDECTLLPLHRFQCFVNMHVPYRPNMFPCCPFQVGFWRKLINSPTRKLSWRPDPGRNSFRTDPPQ